MTDEQIRQNAKEYADVFGRHMADYYGVKDAFISGAHSRDEEFEKLKRKYEAARDVLGETEKSILSLNKELDQLRNRRISA